MAKNILFSFEDMSSKDKLVRVISREFQRAGATIAQVDVDPRVKRTSGISYREMNLTFVDSQAVTLQIKQTGDIFAVKLNKKIVPIKNQDDHKKAVEQLAQAMNTGRAKFQKALARVKVALPKTVRTAAPKLEQVLRDRIADLDVAITAAREELAALRPAGA